MGLLLGRHMHDIGLSTHVQGVHIWEEVIVFKSLIIIVMPVQGETMRVFSHSLSNNDCLP
jgi:hypothetical protein